MSDNDTKATDAASSDVYTRAAELFRNANSGSAEKKRDDAAATTPAAAVAPSVEAKRATTDATDQEAEVIMRAFAACFEHKDATVAHAYLLFNQTYIEIHNRFKESDNLRVWQLISAISLVCLKKQPSELKQSFASIQAVWGDDAALVNLVNGMMPDLIP